MAAATSATSLNMQQYIAGVLYKHIAEGSEILSGRPVFVRRDYFVMLRVGAEQGGRKVNMRMLSSNIASDRGAWLGWRGYYFNHHDSRWGVLRDNPRSQKLMAFVKADVDAQWADQNRINAADDFNAKLDAAMAD